MLFEYVIMIEFSIIPAEGYGINSFTGRNKEIIMHNFYS